MHLTVFRVTIPAMSTIGYGTGKDERGKSYQFVGDHRPIRHLGQAVAGAASVDELPTVDLEDWQLTNPSRSAH